MQSALLSCAKRTTAPLSRRENTAAYRACMARLPLKKHFTLDIDLLAEWRPYPDEPAPPQSDRDLRYFGTVTYNGVTGAIARKGGGDGVAIGLAPACEFPLWERIRLNEIMQFEHPPGKELLPKFPEDWRRSYG